jgi:hypothetical protein
MRRSAHDLRRPPRCRPTGRSPPHGAPRPGRIPPRPCRLRPPPRLGGAGARQPVGLPAPRARTLDRCCLPAEGGGQAAPARSRGGGAAPGRATLPLQRGRAGQGAHDGERGGGTAAVLRPVGAGSEGGGGRGRAEGGGARAHDGVGHGQGPAPELRVSDVRSRNDPPRPGAGAEGGERGAGSSPCCGADRDSRADPSGGSDGSRAPNPDSGPHSNASTRARHRGSTHRRPSAAPHHGLPALPPEARCGPLCALSREPIRQRRGAARGGARPSPGPRGQAAEGGDEPAAGRAARGPGRPHHGQRAPAGLGSRRGALPVAARGRWVCGSTWQLEVHHLQPRARGGPPTATNLRLLCHAHDAEAARLTFGDLRMARPRGRRGRRGRSVAGAAGPGDDGPPALARGPLGMAPSAGRPAKRAAPPLEGTVRSPASATAGARPKVGACEGSGGGGARTLRFGGAACGRRGPRATPAGAPAGCFLSPAQRGRPASADRARRAAYGSRA